MALNEQMQQAVQQDIQDAEIKPKEKILKEQMAGLKSTGKFIGETVVESIPGVSQAIGVKRTSDALEKDDYVGAGIEGTALAASVVPVIGPAVAKGLRKFNKTRKAYKLFVKGEDGELYPLFVDANKSVKQGEFLEANFPDVAFKGKRKEGSKENFYVPTKGAKRSKGEKTKGTGDSIIIPDETTRKKLINEGFITEKTRRTKEAPFGKVTAVAARPGWHASQAPVATHLGPQDLKVTKKEAKKLVEAGVTPEAIKRRGNQFYVKRRAEDQVFAEVDMADDVDYQSMLAKEGKSDINDRVPKGGSYRYSDGQADSDQWVVGGDMKVNRVLSREETRAIQKEMGVVDLPYRDEVEAILEKKFAKGGVVMDDYLLGKIMDEPHNFAEGGAVPMNNIAKQMELFADGGLMDEGGMVDEVSGNEVPPGSTREEVRDDIPAQLSEGEFVFPADVVRYFGLEKLMKMRQEAKAGLARMEAMGQMGNSDEATMPDDLPFTIDDLDIEEEDEYNEVQEFAVGGAVQMPGFTGIGGYVQPPAVTTGVAPAPVAAASAPAAPVTAYKPPQQAFTPVLNVPQTMPTFQGTVGFGPEGVEYETVTYVNEAGQTLVLKKNKQTGQLLDLAGNPATIPEGYKLKGEEEVAPVTTETSTVTGQDDGGDRQDYGGGTSLLTGEKIAGYSPEEIKTGVAAAKDRYAITGNRGFDLLNVIPGGSFIKSLMPDAGMSIFGTDPVYTGRPDDSLMNAQQTARDQLQATLGTRITGYVGFQKGDLDPNSGGFFDKNGLAVDPKTGDQTRNESGTMNYSSFKDWREAFAAGTESGWRGGKLGQESYSKLSDKAKKNYNKFAEIMDYKDHTPDYTSDDGQKAPSGGYAGYSGEDVEESYNVGNDNDNNNNNSPGDSNDRGNDGGLDGRDGGSTEGSESVGDG